MIRDDAALVLFSGGQDSATCLAWALERFAHVETIGFDYGQRHRVELEVRQAFRARVLQENTDWAPRFGEDHMLALDALRAVSDTALTRDTTIAMQADGLPNTFAAALAYRRGLKHLVAGMCETDYSGYPDCRDDTLKALQVAINLGMDRRFVLHTPLMWRDKAATWALAERLGGPALVEAIRTDTHSCYLGDRTTLHDWGYGCGHCPACELRRNGWEGWRLAAR